MQGNKLMDTNYNIVRTTLSGGIALEGRNV